MNTATTADTTSTPDLLTTRTLLHPSKRAPNSQAELAAFCEMSRILADDPRAALRRFLDIALGLCNAGSAGVSLLRPNGTGQPSVRWDAIRGALAAHEGTDMPRDFSPCGLCLDAGATVLVARPARVFTYLSDTQPAIVEDLIVPLYDNANQPLGTLWLAHHDATSRFCSDDARIVELLATQLVLALKLLEQARERQSMLALLESHKLAQRNIAYALADERSRRERAEASESGAQQAIAFKDVVIHEVHHRVKNTLQIAANLLSLQARATPSAEVRFALQEGHGRLHVLAKVHELLYKSAESAQEVLMPSLLQAIGDGLRQSFTEMSDRVRLQVICNQIALSPDDAIPMALLTNEAITNAYKHAFPDGASGDIDITLRSTSENVMILQIADNGVGMRSGNEANGLGLTIIRSFAAQLKGALDVLAPAHGSGTVVTLTMHHGAKPSLKAFAKPTTSSPAKRSLLTD